MVDIRSVPLPEELLEIARLHRKRLIDPVSGKIDPVRVRALVDSIKPEVKKALYRDFEELKRRRSEERSRYYEPLGPDDFPPSQQLDFHKSASKIRILLGGNQCLGGETLIFDPILGIHRRVDEIDSDFSVLSWDGSKLVCAIAKRPFTKPVDDLYRITLSDGSSFVASLSHRVLTADGFAPLSRLPVGSSVFRPPTSWELYRSIRSADALHCVRTVEDFQYDYLVCSDSRDARLRSESRIASSAFPSQGDVLQRTEQAFSLSDALGYKSGHNRPYQSLAHPSSQDDRLPIADRASDKLFRAFYKLFESALRLLQVESQSSPASCLQKPTDEFVRSDNLYGCATPFKTSYLVIINMEYVRTDVKYDFTVPIYGNYWHNGIISHNSGKTESLCQEFNWLATGRHPYHQIWAPPVYLRINSVSWKDGHGKITIPKLKEIVCREDLVGGVWDSAFSANLNAVEESMTLKYKNGSFIEMMTYEQAAPKHGGVQRHAIGMDEEPPEQIYDESIPRLSRYNGLMVFAMTPVNGWTWVADKLIYSTDEDIEIFTLPTLSNKHLDPASRDFLLRRYASDPEQAAIRLWGEIVNIGGLVFKTLRNELHVCPDFPIPNHWKRGLFIDPAPSKSHAASWVAVDPKTIHQTSGKHKLYVYKELIFREGSEISTFCKELRDHNEGERIDYFEIDPHWDWDNKAAGGMNIFKEFKKHIPALRPALENRDDIYEEAIKERLNPDLITNDLNAKVGLQIFESCTETLRQLRLLSYERLDTARQQNRDKPRIRKVKNDLVDTSGMAAVSKRLNSAFGDYEGGFSEPDYTRDEFGRITG